MTELLRVSDMAPTEDSPAVRRVRKIPGRSGIPARDLPLWYFAFAHACLALAAASVGLVVYSVRRRWLLAELLVVRKERGVAQ